MSSEPQEEPKLLLLHTKAPYWSPQLVLKYPKGPTFVEIAERGLQMSALA